MNAASTPAPDAAATEAAPSATERERRSARRPRAVAVGVYLVALTLTAVLPMVALWAVILGELQDRDQAGVLAEATHESVAVAERVGQQLRDMVTTSSIIATSPELADGDFAALHARARAAMHASSYYMLLVRPDGQQLLNTRVPYGTPLARTSDMNVLAQALSTGRAIVSDLFFGQTSQRWVYNVVFPLSGPFAARAGALILTQNGSEFEAALGKDRLPIGWHSALIDGAGKVIASTDDSAVGKPLAQAWMQRDKLADRRSGADTTADEIMYGFASVPNTSWLAVRWGPTGAVQQHFGEGWRWLVVGTSSILVIAMAVGIFLAYRLRQAIADLANLARRIGDGAVVSPAYTGVREVDDVSQALSETSLKLRQAEDRVRVVLHELSHRTKNVTQITESLIRQTGRHSDNLGDFVSSLSRRLRGLTQSLTLLTSEDWGDVSMRALVETQLQVFAEAESRVMIEGEDFLARSDVAKTLGMVVHELGTNAVKYGALSVPDGQVRVTWSQDESVAEPVFRFEWSEADGPEIGKLGRKGFGSYLIESSVRSLGGTAVVEFFSNGLQWQIRTPLENVRRAH
ncbi:MAG: sensor histidine kinase [Rhodospirillales bacterium]